MQAITILQLSILFTISCTSFGSSQTRADQPTPSDIAVACELAADSNKLREEHPALLETSTLLAVESMGHARRLESDEALRSSSDLLVRPIFALEPPDPVHVVAFSHSGKWIATGGYNKSLRLLDSKTGSKIFEWTLDSGILTIDVSVDDRYLAVGTAKGLAQIFEIKSRREMTRLQHGGPVNAIAFSPNGRRVATGSDDRLIRVFDSTNALNLVKGEHKDRVTTVAFNTEGDVVVSGSADGLVRAWDQGSGTQLFELPQAQTINAVAVFKDLIATASNDRFARVFNSRFENRPEVARLVHRDSVDSISFSLDGKYVVTASSDSTARVFNASTGEETAHFIHNNAVNVARFSPDGRLVATGSADNTARIFDWQSGRETERLTTSGSVDAIAFHPDGSVIVIASSDGELDMYPVIDRHRVLQLREAAVKAVDLSPDLKQLATGSDDTTVRMFDLTEKPLWKKPLKGPASALVFSPDSKLVATGESYSARIFDAKTGHLNKQMTHSNEVHALAFSADSQYLATGMLGTDEIFARLFSATQNGEDVMKRLRHEESIDALAFSPDGTLLATGSRTSEVRVFQIPTGYEPKHAPMMHDGNPVIALAFSKDNKQLATGSTDDMARIFDVQSGQELQQLPQTAAVVAVRFSHNGLWLATATKDGIVRVFDPATGTQIGQINNYWREIKTIRFSEDDKVLAVVALGPDFVSVQNYIVDPDEMIREACSRLTRNHLTEKEWNQYMHGEPYHETCRVGPKARASRKSFSSF